MQNENNLQWKIIDEFPNYSISNTGLIRNDKTGKYLKHSPKGTGYDRVCLYKDGKRYYRMVHRLLAIAHIPNPDNLPEIDHINTIRNDNRIENLRWCSHKQNVNNSISLVNIGESHKKLIECYTLDNQFVKQYPSTKEAAIELGVTPAAIHNVLKGKRPTCKGYIFKYV